jgi:Fur family transcriptional regulator, ferric uptake regulator
MKPLELLTNHQLRKTQFRERVLDIFLRYDRALSQKDLEEQLHESDRITLYRTLKTFEEKGLIHKAIDGSDRLKYALCAGHCDVHAHHDHHAHFHCVTCERTFCIEDVHAPELEGPPGFLVESTHVIINGRCAECAN